MIRDKFREQVPSLDELIREVKLNHNVNALKRKNIFNQPYPLVYDHKTCRYLAEGESQAEVNIVSIT